jgi:hypothetical protein
MAPPSGVGRDPSENHETVEAEDGTRLFLRRMPKRDAATSPSPAGIRAIFCDGILCDGFIWKYLSSTGLRWGHSCLC